MFKILKSGKFVYKLANFMDYYLNKSIELFLDTGIETENLIIESYELSSYIYKKEINENLEKYFSEDFLVKKFLKNGKYLAIISVGNFRLFVEYTENKDEKIRFLEDIEIYKK
ncbi:hypothetical protein DLH72_03330 [Candidatus Gracilibacteria bacterium]|nr:MAG: hypothetical protein DLH72_03330 [Candidatus Gracilibacteria bacterium]